MPATFTGKRIIVTGGAGGIGIETVRTFMEHGGHVVMADRDETALARAQSMLGGSVSPRSQHRWTARPSAPGSSKPLARRCTR